MEELVQVVLRSGTSKYNVSELAVEVVKLLRKQGLDIGIKELKSLHGISIAKATAVLAAIEIGKRLLEPYGKPVLEPHDAIQIASEYISLPQEHLVCLTLNGAAKLIAKRVIGIGTLNTAVTHPREVYADAIVDRAAQILLIHNHPSGDPHPSLEDVEFTKLLRDAGRILGIPLNDHVVVSPSGSYFSFAEEGLL
jgi:DNA repair protein RadC